MADAETPPLCQGGFGLHRHVQMVANTEDRATLKKAYDGLRAANEELAGLERDRERWMATKAIYFQTGNNRPSRREREIWESFRDWWSHAGRNAVLESETSIDEELSRLNVSSHSPRETQDALRHSINKLSRPFFKKPVHPRHARRDSSLGTQPFARLPARRVLRMAYRYRGYSELPSDLSASLQPQRPDAHSSYTP
ncbi:hypothetical protein B0T26DRAFT_710705 [Lasiosphaeria miniovina]|uniref:Uncharacterized protein n=1 Tax=Lasiosphaeria miniovina TaxID=1954250 RepID=A0AA40AKW0_9PEZI|nr:uncharacterized protein B0T26DRAFT_710705 [Lasiosphaeria miniovina]KAK0717721.1 hypothetical protein B0T26DRAFT_710705 [Lasiosphaeria miniovina]